MKTTSSLAALLAAALLQACGGGSDNRQPPASPTQGESPKPAPAPSPAPAPNPSPAPAPAPAPPPPAVTAVGPVLGPVAASARIGAAGGRLDAPDQGLSVIVPPGAFDREQHVTLQPIVNEAPGGRGQAWRIAPEGLNTPVPITIEWTPNAAHRDGATQLRIASQGADGIWRRSRQGSTGSEGIVRTTTRHFSDWALVAGYQVKPGKVELQVGHSIDLTLVDCQTRPDPTLPDMDQLMVCGEQAARTVSDSGWAVNDVIGGNAQTGVLERVSVQQGLMQFRYRAPATLPARNPVAVTARFDDLSGSQAPPVELVANIVVVDAQSGCTWIQGVQQLQATLEQDYRWHGGDDQATTRFSHFARVQGTLTQLNPSPVGAVWFSGSFDRGWVVVDHVTTNLLDGSEITVTANEAPKVDARQPQVYMFVDLATCTMRYVGNVTVAALHLSKHQGRVDQLENRFAAMGFAVAGVPMAGRRAFEQDRLLPLYTGPRSVQEFAVIEGGAHHAFVLPSGQARVRWTLAPQ